MVSTNQKAKGYRPPVLRNLSARVAKATVKPGEGLPESPLMAMLHASRRSRNLSYPIAPFPYTNLTTLLRWTIAEWDHVKDSKGTVLPAIVLVGLLTWEKEKRIKEERWFELEMEYTKRQARQLQDSLEYPHLKRKRKLLGIIPLP